MKNIKDYSRVNQWIIKQLMYIFWFKSVYPITGSLCWIKNKDGVFIVYFDKSFMSVSGNSLVSANKWKLIRIPK
jgi:hypothetical protein